MEKIARRHSRETNIAQSEVEYYIRLKTKPECYFLYCTPSGALTGLLYWLVYANQLQRCFLAIEQQFTQKVSNLALADHSKVVCLYQTNDLYTV